MMDDRFEGRDPSDQQPTEVRSIRNRRFATMAEAVADDRLAMQEQAAKEAQDREQLDAALTPTGRQVIIFFIMGGLTIAIPCAWPIWLGLTFALLKSEWARQ